MRNFKSIIVGKLWLPLFAVCLVGFSSQSGFSQRPAFSTSEVYRIADNAVVPGAYSSLMRNANGIALTLHTEGLQPGAYTVWWVVENYPENCTERPCSLADEENPAVASSVLNATGAIVGKSGIGNFGAWLGAGDTGGREVLFGPGLLNPLGADIYPVLRYHGPIIPELIKEQLGTYDGGCLINACSDEQTAFHMP